MTTKTPLRVLFLCTANSARSQIAEAILTRKANGRFIAGSAGSHPAPAVNPLAVEVLAEQGIGWDDRHPRSIDDVIGEKWDIAITVCDHAKEACPFFPGQPVFAHWGLPDPAAVTGPRQERLRAFWETAVQLGRRINLLIALPVEKLDRHELALRLQEINDKAEAERV